MWSLTIVLLILFKVGHNIKYVNIGQGQSCNGSSTVEDVHYIYDLQSLRDSQPEGWEYNGYHITVCGPLLDAFCNGDWCFEQYLMQNNTCIEGITRWDTTSINYYAIVNMTSVDGITSGVRVSIVDNMTYHEECNVNYSTINYDIYCSHNATVVQEVKEDTSNCTWEIIMLSPNGCLNYELVTITNNDDNLSVGSIILLIVFVTFFVYLILGCAYNSFYHGRVGFDAFPNKNGWIKCFRFTKAGCETTRDCLCCGRNNNQYTEL